MKDRDSKEADIIKAICALCDEQEKVVSFESDFGEGSLTIYVGDNHTHVGFPGATHQQMIDSLYDLLINGKGLSFAIPVTDMDVSE